MRLPLEGVRVLNLGWVWAGSMAGHVLGDFGADVVRITSTSGIDVIPNGPPRLREETNRSCWGENIYRNQLSVCLNLRHAEGPPMVRALARRSNILFDNFRPGFLERIGLGSEELRAINPSLVHVSMTPTGQDGPYATMPAYGATVTALAGLNSMQGYPGGEPMGFRQAFSYSAAGVWGAMLAAGAYFRARRTGEGTHIQLAQNEMMAHTLTAAYLGYVESGVEPGPRGNRHPALAPHGVYPCRGDDIWIAIAARDDREWQRLAGRLVPAMGDDARFATAAGRKASEDELDAAIGASTATYDRGELVTLLQGDGIPAMPVLGPAELFTHGHFASRGSWVQIDRDEGREVIYGVPWKLSRTPGAVRRPPPLLGEDTEQVCRNLLGLSEDDYRRFEREGLFQ